jgi:colicin import membrane protein
VPERFLKNSLGPFFKAALLHALVIALLVYSWAGPQEPPVKPKFNTVKASLVAPPKPAVVAPKPSVDKKAQQEAKKRKAQEKAKQKKLQEKKRQQKIAKEKAAKTRRLAKEEKRRKEQEAKKQLEKERKAAEEKKRKADQKAELESMRKKEAERLSELEKLRSQETQRLESLEYSEEQKIISQYRAAIQHQVQRAWSRPPSARKGMQSVLKITMIPGGEVISVSVVEGSGHAAFDRSAEQAVRRAGILPVPPDAAIFDRHFRTIELIFRPEDL